MNTKNRKEQSQDESRDAFIANMKKRVEEAQASGQSTEQIREQIASSARAESRKRAPQTAAQARSWWVGVRNFLLIGAVALGLAVGLALLVDRSYASPLCAKYAAQKNLVFQGLDYPQLGSNSSTSSPSRCIFSNATTVAIGKLDPNFIVSTLADFAMTIEITVPAFFIGVALLVVVITRKR
jgi:hypothetical protein